MLTASIIIPVFNAENTIELCISSLLDQNYNKSLYEILVINDGSNDETEKILNEYEAKGQIKFINQINQGPAIARNNGAKQSSNEILIFTDSDCELDVNWLSEMLKPFENQEIVGVQGRYKTKQKSLTALFDQVDIETRYNKMRKPEYIDFLSTYSCAYRKNVFNSSERGERE